MCLRYAANSKFWRFQIWVLEKTKVSGISCDLSFGVGVQKKSCLGDEFAPAFDRSVEPRHFVMIFVDADLGNEVGQGPFCEDPEAGPEGQTPLSGLAVNPDGLLDSVGRLHVDLGL